MWCAFPRNAVMIRRVALASQNFTRALSTPSLPVKEYLVLQYDYVDGMLEKRGPYRPGHFKHAQSYKDTGKFVNGGAYTDPCDGAILLFQDATKADVEEFARKDPYVVNGLVTSWRVRTWNVVL